MSLFWGRFAQRCFWMCVGVSKRPAEQYLRVGWLSVSPCVRDERMYKTESREERLTFRELETICYDLNVSRYVVLLRRLAAAAFTVQIDSSQLTKIRDENRNHRRTERMSRGQRRAGSEQTVTSTMTSTTTSNGVLEPPVTVPDYGKLNCFIQTIVIRDFRF